MERGPTTDNGFWVATYDLHEEPGPSAYFLVVDVTRENLQRLRDTIDLALTTPRRQLRRNQAGRKVTSWTVMGGDILYSMAGRNTRVVPSELPIVDGVVEVQVNSHEWRHACTTAAGGYVTERVDWCWSYSEKGAIRLYTACIQGAALAFYPLLYVTRTNLGQLRAAVDAALAAIGAPQGTQRRSRRTAPPTPRGGAPTHRQPRKTNRGTS